MTSVNIYWKVYGFVCNNKQIMEKSDENNEIEIKINPTNNILLLILTANCLENVGSKFI